MSLQIWIQHTSNMISSISKFEEIWVGCLLIGLVFIEYNTNVSCNSKIVNNSFQHLEKLATNLKELPKNLKKLQKLDKNIKKNLKKLQKILKKLTKIPKFSFASGNPPQKGPRFNPGHMSDHYE